MKILLISQDLMIGSRLEGAARQHELSVTTVRNQEAVADVTDDADCCLVVIDLRLPGLNVDSLVNAIRKSRSTHLPIVACGPHVHEAKLAAAREAGCEAVVTRGQFDRDAEAIIKKLLSVE